MLPVLSVCFRTQDFKVICFQCRSIWNNFVCCGQHKVQKRSHAVLPRVGAYMRLRCYRTIFPTGSLERCCRHGTDGAPTHTLCQKIIFSAGSGQQDFLKPFGSNVVAVLSFLAGRAVRPIFWKVLHRQVNHQKPQLCTL